ncbi:MAG TPA: response regulator, partial [Candidatus Omnitrophota bacterium]|nr:response regulator [Candidatus Omnitrophota bacterium]
SPGRGALFSVYLPACQDVVMSPAADQKDVLVPSGHKKILLMDDEDALRNSMASLLSNYGFDVHAVAHGEDAIQKFQKEKIARQPFDLVILDLTIKGGWGGKETVGKLRDISRDVKIIAASGYSQDPVLAHYREYGFDGIVVKPFTVAELMHAMSALS